MTVEPKIPGAVIPPRVFTQPGSIAAELRCPLASVHPSISDIDVAVSRMSKWDQQAISNAWSEMKVASDRGRLYCCAVMQSN